LRIFLYSIDPRTQRPRALCQPPAPLYAEAVRCWIEQCQFAPAQLGGAARSVRMVQSFHFAH